MLEKEYDLGGDTSQLNVLQDKPTQYNTYLDRFVVTISGFIDRRLWGLDTNVHVIGDPAYNNVVNFIQEKDGTVIYPHSIIFTDLETGIMYSVMVVRDTDGGAIPYLYPMSLSGVSKMKVESRINPRGLMKEQYLLGLFALACATTIALAMSRKIYSLNIPEVEISKDGKELIVTRSLLTTVLEIMDKKQRAESEDMANKPSIYPITPNKISIVRTDNNQYEYRVDDKTIVTVDDLEDTNNLLMKGELINGVLPCYTISSYHYHLVQCALSMFDEYDEAQQRTTKMEL